MKQKLPKLERETTGLKLFPLVTIMGWVLIGFSILISIIVLAPTASAYWGGNVKAIRDAAEIGTPLLGQLTLLAWWPKLLPPLTFLGVTFFMLGIALEFAAIPGILDRRTVVLVKALPLMGKKSQTRS
jgi:hypothetical protein